ncbi:methyltransferase [Streptomyces sp. NA04227]|uniref:ATP-grasp peptide maturase system methyltransferase n=1 Tax=Streptomyces sp. NA04227 TaxID=2742136 RepID=UPI0015922EBB|nr:ATP-grasp peptide maturase system methyltransferase [Streptomyces sp. NA04227]QKW08220.1 methyltransferase [Streptomyces sp. NA04227]
MTTDPAALRRALAEHITASGSLTEPGWRAAVESVPREVFLGSAVFRPDGTAWEPVRRGDTDEDAWLRMVYGDQTWVTQVEGVHADATGAPVSGSPTSSSTLPSLVVRMLEEAGISERDRVLEIGTGTGYSTAVLCHRLGSERITSVEYDRDVADRAAAALRECGYAPTLVIGDGLLGHRPRAPYDALVATCAVRTVPFSWMTQVREGGTLTTTISGWMLASGLVRLTLSEDGGASGRFTGDQVSYMLARPHERPPCAACFQHYGTARECFIDPHELENWTGRFVAQLAAPSAELMTTGDGVLLVDVATGSQAWTEAHGRTWIVHQHGPLRLWDQVEAAVSTWHQAGAPDQSAFGMSVTPDHTQHVWIGAPDGPSWPLPA